MQAEAETKAAQQDAKATAALYPLLAVGWHLKLWHVHATHILPLFIFIGRAQLIVNTFLVGIRQNSARLVYSCECVSRLWR